MGEKQHPWSLSSKMFWYIFVLRVQTIFFIHNGIWYITAKLVNNVNKIM